MEQGITIAIQLLAAGYNVASVATTLQVPEDTVLAVQEEYAQAITDTALAMSKEVTITPAAKAVSHDEKMDTLESKLLEQLSNSAVIETNPMKLARLFQIVNGAKRRSVGEGYHGPVTVDNRKVVMLDLPEHINRRPKFTVSPNNEVVAVEGKALAIASTDYVNKLAGIVVEGEKAEVLTHDKGNE